MSSADTPEASSDDVAARMKATPQRDTPPEMELRKELHSRGLRYRVDRSMRPITRGRPDIVFPTEEVAVFVDGCFWHLCPEHGSIPDSNSDWWRSKLEANAKRDERHTRELEEAGWKVIRIWEHEDLIEAADRVEEIVTERREDRE